MNTVESFPVRFDGKCYDLNKFLRDHPGGVNTLVRYKGMSVDGAMTKFGHSTGAYHMLNDFKVNDPNDVDLTGDVSDSGRLITSEENSRDEEEIAFLEELEAKVDWSKAILGQLEALGPHYTKWVNCAVYRTCRMFQNPLLESITYTPWFAVPIYWVPVIAYILISQYAATVQCGETCREARLSNIQFVYQVSTGVVLWTALEYSIHRWLFHMNPGSSIFLRKLHFVIHGIHHKVPFDKDRQVFPLIPANVVAIVFSVPYAQLFDYHMLKLAGTFIGYLTYDMIHCYLHIGSPKHGTYLYAMKRYHSNHHFLNHDKAFGISSKVWDVVFRTFVRVKKLGFSLQW